MDLWTALLDILILLAAAMLLGGLCERLKQSPLLGYLLAGTLLGPNVSNVLPNHAAVSMIAELGLALLLFTIGLEFSWRRFRAVGAIAVGGGTLQVLVTGGLAAAFCMIFGLDGRAAIAVGAMIAMSSTATVLRLLTNRAEIETVRGRNAVGILLLQDIAVVPLMMVVVALGAGGTIIDFGLVMGQALGLAAVLVGALHVLLNHGLPLLLGASVTARYRDLPILVAIVTAVGSAWLSHYFGFSPLLGAFIAGMLLAESPFATQIRSDIMPLQTLFVTLFFSSIGMLSNPGWAVDNWTLLVPVVAAIVIGKTVVTSAVVRLFRCPIGPSVATGILLAQVGEFSLVIATVARQSQVIDANVFDLILAALIITLFITPYLASLAPRLSAVITARWPHRGPEEPPGSSDTVISDHLIVVGFGPAGQRVVETLLGEGGRQILVVDQVPATVAHAQSYGLKTVIGDATREEVLESLHIRSAAAAVITVPDPNTAQQIVERVRAMSPDTIIVARARYHIYRWQLDLAGAHAVVDEENEVGLRIASEVQERLYRINP